MEQVGWAASYLGRVRAAVGDDMPLLLVGARVVLRDDSGRVLLIQRSDNGLWAFPAGAMEVGESISACAARELFEETGLRALDLTLFASQSTPTALQRNQYGHLYQPVIHAFRADRWEGDLVRATDETLDAGFFDDADLPLPQTASVAEVLADLAHFERTGCVTVR